MTETTEQRLDRIEAALKDAAAERNALELALWLILNSIPHDTAQRLDLLKSMQETLMAETSEHEVVFRQTRRVLDVIERLQPSFPLPL